MISITYTSSIELKKPLEDVFPLFTPEGEKLWAPGWDYVNVMGTTELSEGYVFTTSHHDHASSDAIWIVNRYDPEDFTVQYYRIEPGVKVGIVNVVCRELDGNHTIVEVTYKYIGLTESGDTFIREYTQDEYEQFITGWKIHIERYFSSSC